MTSWLAAAIEAASPAAALLGALVLGLIAAASISCQLAGFGALAGYAAAVGTSERRRPLLEGVSFLVGTAGAIAILLAVAILAQPAAHSALGTAWKVVSAYVVVAVALVMLGLLPWRFRIPVRGPRVAGGSLVYGAALGGGLTVCTAGCTPVLPLVMAYAVARGHAWAAALAGAFAVGYASMLAGVFVGFATGLGRLAARYQAATHWLRLAAGVILLGDGFYLLWTL